jgi:hypothetical protein
LGIRKGAPVGDMSSCLRGDGSAGLSCAREPGMNPFVLEGVFRFPFVPWSGPRLSLILYIRCILLTVLFTLCIGGSHEPRSVAQISPFSVCLPLGASPALVPPSPSQVPSAATGRSRTSPTPSRGSAVVSPTPRSVSTTRATSALTSMSSPSASTSLREWRRRGAR